MFSRHTLEAELLVGVDRLHAGKGAAQAGSQAVGLAYQAVHHAELFDVTRQQQGHTVLQLGEIVLVVGDAFGSVIALNFERARA